MNGGSGSAADASEQSLLRPDLDAIVRYAEVHPDVVVQVRFAGSSPVKVAALLCGDVDRHAEAIRQTMANPDRLVVERCRWPPSRLTEIRRDIEENGRDAFCGLGLHWGRVEVRLWADRVAYARELDERYGAALRLTVGFLRYPDPALRDDEFVRPPMSTPALPDTLHVRVDDPLSVVSGRHARRTLHLSNLGPAEVIVSTNGHITPEIVDPESGRPVGSYEGAQTLPLVRFRAEPGGSVDIPLLIGTASTEPSLGYAVPPGRWALEAVLRLEGGSARTPHLPITIDR